MKDIVAMIFGFGMMLNAALFVPQALRLWRTKTASDISIPPFLGFNLLQSTGILHGWFQGDWALTLGMVASLVTCGSVTLLAIRYRNRALPAGVG